MLFNIKKYAKLARIRLTKKEEEKFQKDLEEVLGHVEELKKIKVKNVNPMTGGTSLRNVFRDDAGGDVLGDDAGTQFPEVEKGYLKVPKVFDNE